MKNVMMCFAVAFAGLFTTTSANATVIFSDNFEAAGAAGAAANAAWAAAGHTNQLAVTLGAPWEMSKFVYTSTGAYIGHYAPGFTFGPNAIEAGGPGESAYNAKIWPDYSQGGDWAPGNKIVINLNVAKPNLSGADISPGAWSMDFDYLRDPVPGSNAKAYAFMSLLSADWSTTYWSNVIELGSSADWSHGSVGLTFDGTQTGLNVLFGFRVSDADYSGGAGLRIDNVVTASVPEPSVVSLLGFGVLGLVATRFRRRS